MKLNISNPWRNYSGTYKTTDLIFYQLEGEVIARSKIAPADPNTPEQQKVRSTMAVCAANWQTLDSTVRDSWQAYANKYFCKDSYGRACRTQALPMYIRANSVRLILGLPMTIDPPVEGCPMRLRKVTQIAGLPDNTIGIRVEHDYANRDGYQVIVRATAPLSSLAHGVPDTAYRYVCGVGPQSAQALPPDAGELVFAGVRSPVAAGQRYGVEARVVRIGDGMMSVPVYGDFIKD